MSVVIESTSVQSSFALGTDIGSQREFSVTAPTGITVGDLLVFVCQTSDTGGPEVASGWTEITLPSKDSTMMVQYKYADSGDAAASTFDFTADNDNARMMWIMYRLTGGITSGTPVVASDGFSELATSTSLSRSVSVAQNTGSLLMVLVSGNEFGTDAVGDISNMSLTGPTVTLTERLDPEGTQGVFGAVYDGVSSSDDNITNVAFDYGDDTGDNDTIRVSVLDFRAQQNATYNATLTETTNQAFTPVTSSSATYNATLTTTANEALTPTVSATSYTNWSLESRPSTAQDAEDAIWSNGDDWVWSNGDDVYFADETNNDWVLENR